MEEKGLEQIGSVNSFGELMKREDGGEKKVYTTVTDEKILFNLDSSCDYKINDCIGEKIKIKDVVIKINKKPLKEPIINEETGEIVKEYETNMITIIISEDDKSYVTASKTFTIKFMRLIEMFGVEKVKGMVIEFCKQSVKNSDNKALGFKLI